jgi:hypothetical protein
LVSLSDQQHQSNSHRKHKRMSNIFPHLTSSSSKNKNNNMSNNDGTGNSDAADRTATADGPCNELGVGRAIPVSIPLMSLHRYTNEYCSSFTV